MIRTAVLGVDEVVLSRVLGALSIIWAAVLLVLFVFRIPTLWFRGYTDGISERGPKLSKANMNRGLFLLYFYLWILRSRLRSAVLCAFMFYVGWRLWIVQPILPR